MTFVIAALRVNGYISLTFLLIVDWKSGNGYVISEDIAEVPLNGECH